MGDIDKVCDDYSVYVDKLEAMSKKEKKKFLDEKFEKRLLPKKEGHRKIIWLIKEF